MYCRVVDGCVEWAFSTIACTLTKDERRKIRGQKETGCIVCYTVEEQNIVTRQLDVMKVKYSIVPYTPDSTCDQKCKSAKAKGYKFTSRSQAIDHMQNGTPLVADVSQLLIMIQELQSQVDALTKGGAKG